jgi:hypothetical protein
MELGYSYVKNYLTMNENKVIITNQSISTNLAITSGQRDSSETGKANSAFFAEGGLNFYNYIRRLGLESDPDIVVISSLRHFYYDAEEMIKVKTLVNLTELNQVKRIVDFLHTCYQILPQKSYLIGCFVDNKKIPRYRLRNSSASNLVKIDFDPLEYGIVSAVPFINRLYSIMDSKTNIFMSKSSISFLLEDYGFKVLDMTEHDELTYFQAQKARAA